MLLGQGNSKKRKGGLITADGAFLVVTESRRGGTCGLSWKHKKCQSLLNGKDVEYHPTADPVNVENTEIKNIFVRYCPKCEQEPLEGGYVGDSAFITKWGD